MGAGRKGKETARQSKTEKGKGRRAPLGTSSTMQQDRVDETKSHRAQRKLPHQNFLDVIDDTLTTTCSISPTSHITQPEKRMRAPRTKQIVGIATSYIQKNFLRDTRKYDHIDLDANLAKAVVTPGTLLKNATAGCHPPKVHASPRVDPV